MRSGEARVGGPRGAAPRSLGVAAAFAAAALLSGCGSSDPSGPQPPQRCLDSWNDDGAATTLGKHAYAGHDVRRALVELSAAPEAKNVRSERTCLVVFAVAEGDGEEGRLGLVVTRFGWSQLFELGLSDAALTDLQRSATARSNADLFPDGTLE